MPRVAPTTDLPGFELNLDLDSLRRAIQLEYAEVAEHPELGFHFSVGRPLARILGYDPAWLDGIPESSIESFAGTGNPFSLGRLQPPGARTFTAVRRSLAARPSMAGWASTSVRTRQPRKRSRRKRSRL
jgi:hypothetical protein